MLSLIKRLFRIGQTTTQDDGSPTKSLASGGNQTVATPSGAGDRPRAPQEAPRHPAGH